MPRVLPLPPSYGVWVAQTFLQLQNFLSLSHSFIKTYYYYSTHNTTDLLSSLSASCLELKPFSLSVFRCFPTVVFLLCGLSCTEGAGGSASLLLQVFVPCNLLFQCHILLGKVLSLFVAILCEHGNLELLLLLLFVRVVVAGRSGSMLFAVCFTCRDCWIRDS